jgi:hypothetical protein
MIMAEFKVVDRRIKMDEESKPDQAQPRPTVSQGQTDEKAGQRGLQNNTLPQVCFSTLILSLSSSALVHLGEVPDPETGKPMENLVMAKHTIDILAMLAEKTRGNLSTEEANLLKDMLFELRMKYVQKAS